MSDRERDRLLTLAGWRVLRYGPSDVKTPEQARRSAQFFVEVIRQIKEGLI
jgi:very-short-patch-repair endonuclease